MPTILRFWCQWSWVFHICWALIVATGFIVTYENTIAINTKDIFEIQSQKLLERMVRQEQLTQDIGENLKDIKAVQGKIFDRLNQIADRRHD